MPLTEASLLLHAEATKRGLGAVLLRKPEKLARLVAGIAEGSGLPLTVKVRTGAAGSLTNIDSASLSGVPLLTLSAIGDSQYNMNLLQVVTALQHAGVVAITVHGRTMEQR